MDTSAEYMHACEVRTVARWDEAQRQAYFEDVARKRGATAAQTLQDDVRKCLREGGV